MEVSFVGDQRLELLESLWMKKKWPELLEACSSFAGGGDALVARYFACSLFHCGRLEECLSVLAANKDESWLGRLRLWSVQMDLARMSKTPNSLACLRSICSSLKQLVSEAATDQEREMGCFNLALGFLSLGDALAAIATLEGVVKAALLQTRFQKRARMGGNVEEVFSSPCLKLAREACLLEGLGVNIRLLLAACYFLIGERDASAVLFGSCEFDKSIAGFEDFRTVSQGAGGTVVAATPIGLARKLFAGTKFEDCMATLQGLDSLEALELVGCCCLELGRAQEAVGKFKQCCSMSTVLNLDRPSIYLNLLVAMSMAGESLDEELAVLSTVVPAIASSGQSDRVAALRLRQAGLFWKLARFGEAAAILDQLRCSGEFDLSHVIEFHATVLMKLGRFSDALTVIRKAGSMTVQMVHLKLECLLRLGKVAEMVHDIEPWIDRIVDSSVLCNIALAFLAHSSYGK